VQRYRWLRCSGIRPLCDQLPRAGQPTRWSFRSTRKLRQAWQSPLPDP